MADERFVSKADAWLVAVIVAGIVGGWASIAATLSQAPSGALVLALAVMLLATGLVAWTLLATHYTLTDEQLLVRSGPFSWRIPLREIRTVNPTRNPLSSPALSLDRLRIEYGNRRWIMISPRDQQAFLEALQRRRVRF